MDNQIVQEALFIIFSISTISLALLVIYLKNPIYSSIALIASFIPIAGIYLLMSAPFVAIIEVLVYAGAIMVLFTFVIMMVDLGKKEYEVDKSMIYKLLSLVLILSFLIVLPLLLFFSPTDVSNKKAGYTKVLNKTGDGTDDGNEESLGRILDKEGLKEFGSTKKIGEYIFGKTEGTKEATLKNNLESIAIISFELTSILIIVSIIGVLILAGRYGRQK